MEKFQGYVSPALEVVVIEVEQCFAVSPGKGDGTGSADGWPDFQ